MTRTRESVIAAALIVGLFAAMMLIGFPLRFDGAMPWELLP
ncbi:MAG: hypothetical protein ACOH2M_03360 [Cypionkella sp.]